LQKYDFMVVLEPIFEKLARAQRGLLRAADAVPAELWKTTPKPEAWSAAELVAHLMIVERAVIRAADKIVQKVPKPIPLFKRFHLPMAAAELRLVRLKSPLPLDPALLREKEGMLAELREVRERTLAFMDETRGRDLSAYRWRHPFMGPSAPMSGFHSSPRTKCATKNSSAKLPRRSTESHR
jgi:hypothetical protein